ncbi:hypothetical protein [Pseudomonas phage PaBSM-2607-JFK]|nr:hypothetical protein [Pseudomonas phage PaBSM-2607-JFK]
MPASPPPKPNCARRGKRKSRPRARCCPTPAPIRRSGASSPRW